MTNHTIFDTLYSAGQKSAYNAACKQLLSERIILAWILKHCVKEFHDCDVSDIARQYIEGTPQVSKLPLLPNASSSKIHGIGNEDASLHEGTVTYDIRFLASLPSSEEKITMIINVEAQNNFYPGYPLIKRALYYCCRMISSQYGTECCERYIPSGSVPIHRQHGRTASPPIPFRRHRSSGRYRKHLTSTT